MAPDHIIRQINEMLSRHDMGEAEYRAQYPEGVNWVNTHVDLVDLMRQSGVNLKPISPDHSDVFVGNGCPSCGGPLIVRKR